MNQGFCGGNIESHIDDFQYYVGSTMHVISNTDENMADGFWEDNVSRVNIQLNSASEYCG
ncbi:hypothetical protein IWW55_004605 [Coemansia sp. RSA 2706]|nr:hypothetical protein IWW55_004605 [Coemansia sp. RSA 2706]KAJ2313652.1 hypothetical protein IWW54_001387 [Coemansia sp. RSA 2705]KAJ2322703.1 hypothetical protein IWW51_004111 [Coemansia sp. RSA 2702]